MQCSGYSFSFRRTRALGRGAQQLTPAHRRLVLAGRISASLQDSQNTSRDNYRRFLQKAKECTLKHPEGQLHGRRGRRCVLEDGERLLLRCLDLRPACIEARTLLMQNLISQNRGREFEVPRLAIETLKQTSLRDCSKSGGHADDAVYVVKLGLTALRKAEKPTSSFQKFINHALEFVPDLREEVYACAVEQSFIQKQAHSPSWKAVMDSCDNEKSSR